MEEALAITDGNVGSSASFAPGWNDHEASPPTSIVDLASIYDVHMANSEKSRKWNVSCPMWASAGGPRLHFPGLTPVSLPD